MTGYPRIPTRRSLLPRRLPFGLTDYERRENDRRRRMRNRWIAVAVLGLIVWFIAA